MAMGRSESHVREELLAASDEVIEDAVMHADLKALRGLLYQLTGDDEVARARLEHRRPGDRARRRSATTPSSSGARAPSS